jgi:hypothetical protein
VWAPFSPLLVTAAEPPPPRSRLGVWIGFKIKAMVWRKKNGWTVHYSVIATVTQLTKYCYNHCCYSVCYSTTHCLLVYIYNLRHMYHESIKSYYLSLHVKVCWFPCTKSQQVIAITINHYYYSICTWKWPINKLLI